MVIGQGQFPVSKRMLQPSTKFNGIGLSRQKFPAFKIVVSIETPDPNVGVIEEIVSEKQAIDAIRELEGVAGIDAVEPHERSEEAGRSKIDFLKPDPRFEPGRRETAPKPVEIDISICGGVIEIADVGSAIGIKREFKVDRIFF